MCTQCATITLGKSLPCYSHIHSSHVRIGLPTVKLHGVLLSIMRIEHDSTPASLQSEKKLVVVSMREKTHLGHAVLCDHCSHCVLSLGIGGNPVTMVLQRPYVHLCYLKRSLGHSVSFLPTGLLLPWLKSCLSFVCLFVCRCSFQLKNKKHIFSLSPVWIVTTSSFLYVATWFLVFVEMLLLTLHGAEGK